MRSKPTIARTCEWCGAGFHVWPGAILKGNGRFCSRRCGIRGGKSARTYAELAARITTRLPLPDANGCRVWPGSKDMEGYGTIKWLGNRLKVNRVLWETTHGVKLSRQQFVCHHCDNPPCGEDSHHFVGDSGANTRDMIAKGRTPHGEQHYDAKLTAQAVVQMRERYAAGGITIGRLALEHRVSHGAAWKAVTWRSWKHVR